MHLIRTAEDMARALDSPLDPELKAVLRAHTDRLEPYGPLADLAHFLIAEPGDVLAEINIHCGFELVGGGAAVFATSPELVTMHRGWFEAVFVLSDDGFGLVLLAQRGDGIDPRLLAACTHALEQQGSGADQGL